VNAVASLAGAWEVMNGRPEGLSRLDLSIGGFWKSFGAIALVGPVSLLSVHVEGLGLGEDEAATGMASALLPVALDWVVFPVVLAFLAPAMGLTRGYVPFIVARNWAAAIIAAIFAVPLGATALGLLPVEAMAWLGLVLFALSVRFAYLVARTALGVPFAVAAPLVAMDVLISLVIQGLFAP